MATHSSILAQKIPWAEEPGGLHSMGSQRVTHDSHFHFQSLLQTYNLNIYRSTHRIFHFQAPSMWQHSRRGLGHWQASSQTSQNRRWAGASEVSGSSGLACTSRPGFTQTPTWPTQTGCARRRLLSTLLASAGTGHHGVTRSRWMFLNHCRMDRF